jgi:hypothetical protein
LIISSISLWIFYERTKLILSKNLIHFHFLVVSYNQPKFCANASWNTTVITVAYWISGIQEPRDIFVNTKNTIYAVSPPKNDVRVWLEGDPELERIVSDGLEYPLSVFVSINDDIYIGNREKGQVLKFTSTTDESIIVMHVNRSCVSLFIGIDDNLYCSISSLHQIVKKSLSNDLKALTNVAGTGSQGSKPNMLSTPVGIFVDLNLDLYVADSENHRIQRFESGKANGITVVGNSLLYEPSWIILDGDGYLFILDYGNFRIVRAGPNEFFRCLVGCSKSESSQLNLAFTWSLRFDSYGSIFVADRRNNRIVKFILATNSCGKCNNMNLIYGQR